MGVLNELSLVGKFDRTVRGAGQEERSCRICAVNCFV